jgi:hypothetical protein
MAKRFTGSPREPPILAALRLPFMLLLGFILVLWADAVVLLLAHEVFPSGIRVDSFGAAVLAALVMSAVSVVLQAVIGTNDDDQYYRVAEWESDLSSQTGASQAGILLGSNDDIPAFRWVEKETGRMMVCSSPADCAEIERRHAGGQGLLVDRRRESRQPALWRGRGGDPDGESERGGEARQSRLPEPIVGAAPVHDVLAGWRTMLQAPPDHDIEGRPSRPIRT